MQSLRDCWRHARRFSLALRLRWATPPAAPLLLGSRRSPRPTTPAPILGLLLQATGSTQQPLDGVLNLLEYALAVGMMALAAVVVFPPLGATVGNVYVRIASMIAANVH